MHCVSSGISRWWRMPFSLGQLILMELLMKKLFAAAMLATGIVTPCLAQMPAGVYPGIMTATTHPSMDTPRPTKSKMQVTVIVTDINTVGFLMDGTGIVGNGIVGTSHGFYVLNDPPLSVGTLSLHFGKDYKTAKGTVQLGTMGGGPGMGSSIEGKLKLKRTVVTGPPPEPPVVSLP